MTGFVLFCGYFVVLHVIAFTFCLHVLDPRIDARGGSSALTMAAYGAIVFIGSLVAIFIGVFAHVGDFYFGGSLALCASGYRTYRYLQRYRASA